MSTSEITPSAALKAETSGGTGSSWRDIWPAVVVVLAFLPLLALHACELWGRPHYQFFPLPDYPVRWGNWVALAWLVAGIPMSGLMLRRQRASGVASLLELGHDDAIAAQPAR